jgi:hypothetical protein
MDLCGIFRPYNGELKRCLVEIKSELGQGFVAAQIYDAYEGQFIAKLLSRTDKEQPKKSVRYQEIFGKPATDDEYNALMTR